MTDSVLKYPRGQGPLKCRQTCDLSTKTASALKQKKQNKQKKPDWQNLRATL